MEEIARYDAQHGVVNFEDYAMNTASLVKQVKLIQDVMAQVMKDGEHYGKIPGTNKPTLLKPGAEKLCMVFRLEPDYAIIREFREDTFIAYTVKCTLKHIPTGQSIASGVGSCNSREEKYRWRYQEDATDKQVPKEYWAARTAGDTKEMKRLIGEGMRTVKVEGVWWIANATKVANDNPWDLDNTIMKMACKRALVAATLNATAASDIFTQDVEDMPSDLVGHQNGDMKSKEPVKQPQAKSSTDGNSTRLSEAQMRKIQVEFSRLKVAEADKHKWVCDALGLPALESMKDLTVAQAISLIDTMTKMEAPKGE